MTGERAMALALAQARRSVGRTYPNPCVGAVIFRGSRILARGRTRPPGGLHAEAVAVQSAVRRHGQRAVRGASMAVTLEPCCHTGRTGPCTRAIIEAGIERVFVGCRDPHSLVAGRGLRRLRAAGIDVTVGVLEEACRAHHRGFLSVCGRGRPFVTLKLATSLDGRIATRGGESRWITGERARAFVHSLRARTDAIMVGSGTALADDPELTARRDGTVIHRPTRVLVDSRLRVPTSSQLYSTADSATWVLHRRGARGAKVRRASGAHLLEVRSRLGHLDLQAALSRLGAEGLTTLLVEGGGELAAALLRGNLVDELHWIQAPMLLGADARPALGVLGLEKLAAAPALSGLTTRRLGEDLHLYGRIG